jgi:phosphoribosylglycinamide formyltransferase-1
MRKVYRTRRSRAISTSNPSEPRLAVLVSGVGSILDAIIAAGVPVSLVVADRTCRGLELAETHGIKTRLVDRRDYGYALRREWDRTGFTRAVAEALDREQIDLVAMAGFMTVFAPVIFTRYENRILNTHPSLLPTFKGEHAVPQALAAGVAETGCTVHIATAELDSGRILAQERVPVLPGDTPDSLQERIKVVERRLYPATIEAYWRELAPAASNL